MRLETHLSQFANVGISSSRIWSFRSAGLTKFLGENACGYAAQRLKPLAEVQRPVLFTSSSASRMSRSRACFGPSIRVFFGCYNQLAVHPLIYAHSPFLLPGCQRSGRPSTVFVKGCPIAESGGLDARDSPGGRT